MRPFPPRSAKAHYIGEGAYEGLEFHYYFADLDIAEGGAVLAVVARVEPTASNTFPNLITSRLAVAAGSRTEI